MVTCKSRNRQNVKVKIRAGARCQLTRLWRENFSAIDVRCLPSRLPSPPPSLPHRQASSSSTCTNKSRASKKGCQQIWRISRVCTSGIWREEQVRPRESNGPSLEPRGFGKPSPTYPAPSNIYCSCSSCPYNPLPTYNFTKWLMKDSGVFGACHFLTSEAWFWLNNFQGEASG